MRKHRVRHTLAAFALAALLGACGTTPEQPGSDVSGDAQVQQLLERARQSESPERERLLLSAAGRLADQDEPQRARNLLLPLDSRELNDETFIHYTQLLGELAMDSGDYFLARRTLTNARLDSLWHELKPEEEIAVREQRARIFALLGNIPASVRERLQLGALLPDERAEQRNRDLIWQTLMSLPQEQLQQFSVTESDRQLRGWYTLAALSKDHQANLERQLAQVDAWREDWPEHPASEQLPDDLRLLQRLIDDQPQQVALLLPQSGHLAHAAEAVRDGFFAAYYQAVEEDSRTPQVRQYDTHEADIVDVYERAVAEGAEMIIGPLNKDQVNDLSLLPALPVPILTLNYADAAPLEQAGEFYQFGLAAEDEARQVARRAHLDGHSHAMILTPTQDWSERSARAFTKLWQEQNGTVVNYSQFTDNDYSGLLSSALLIDASKNRHQQLQRLFGTSLAFNPRRRQDLDMIFLIARPDEARQIKPTLAFHYAADVPVYATSHIYAGVTDSANDRDLEGIRFNTMPWLFDTDSPEKQALDKHGRAPATYSRLHALGVDSYRLYPRLPQLARTANARYYGATGALQLRPDGRIERKQIWAQYRGGVARPLNDTPADGD